MNWIKINCKDAIDLGDWGTFIPESEFIENSDDEDKWIRIKALEILGDIKEGINVDKVISLLRDKDKLVQIKAIETLGKIGGHKSVQALLNFIKDIKDFELIDIAEKVLEKM